MLSRSTLLSTLVLLTMATATSWFIWGVNTRHPQHKPAVAAPTAFAINLTVTQMNKNGLIHSIISTPKLQRQTNGNIILTTPHIITYSTSRQKWLIDAKNGLIYDHNQQVRLWGHVKAQLAKTTTTMTTSVINYNLKNSMVETTQPVRFTRLGSVLHAIGMRANLKLNTIKLLSQTRGVYLHKS